MLPGGDVGQLRLPAPIEAAQGAQPEHTRGAPRAGEGCAGPWVSLGTPAGGGPGRPGRGEGQASGKGLGRGSPEGGQPARQGVGVITGPKAGHRRVQGWQPLQAQSPRDPLPSPWSWLPGHVRRAVTQDPSQVGHAAATVWRVSIISDEGALTITSLRPLPDTCTQALAAHWSSKAPCTGRVLCPGAVQADGTDAPLLCPHSPPHWWRPWVWREDPCPRPGRRPSCLQPPSSSRFSRGPGLGERGATGRDAPALDWVYPLTKATQGSTHPVGWCRKLQSEDGRTQLAQGQQNSEGRKERGGEGEGRKRSWGEATKRQ